MATNGDTGQSLRSAGGERRGAATGLTAVIADDYPIVREGLRAMLEKLGGLKVVAVCVNGEDALAAIREHRPDLAILDVWMPSLTGLEVLSEIRRERLRTRVVLLTVSIAPAEISAAIAAGVSGIVMKHDAADELLECIAVVARRGRWVPEGLKALSNGSAAARWDGKPGRLTAQEQNIAGLLSEGLSNREIARKLNVTEGTIKVHLRNIFDKLQVTSRTAVAVAAARSADPDNSFQGASAA